MKVGNVSARLAPVSRVALAALFTLVVAVAGCASSDGASSSDDVPTPEEIADGEAWQAAGGAEHGDDASSGGAAGEALEPAEEKADTLSITTPAEDSAPFLDKEEASLPLEQPAPMTFEAEEVQQTQTCHRATGYRSGRAFTICITKVDGKWVEVNTARAYLRMKRAARARGVALYVVSGFRTMAQQRYLYNCYKTKRCNGGNLAAPPGYSNHQSGKALDLNTSARGVYSYLANHGRAYGFRRTVPSEKWHWEH